MNHSELNQPYRQCPRFRHCSVNNCPLDPKQDSRPNAPGEPRCKLGKARRFSIGNQYKQLPLKGLTPREAVWANLSEDEKKVRLDKLKKYHFKSQKDK